MTPGTSSRSASRSRSSGHGSGGNLAPPARPRPSGSGIAWWTVGSGCSGFATARRGILKITRSRVLGLAAGSEFSGG